MTDVVRPVGVLRTQVEIRTYPRDDEAFQHLVLEQLRRFDRIRHAAAIPARLEVLLQDRYPRARSRYQDPLASTAGMPLAARADALSGTKPAPRTRKRASRCHTAGGTDVTRGSYIGKRTDRRFVRACPRNCSTAVPARPL